MIPDDIKKIERNQFLTYLDTTPSTNATYKPLGIGVTEYAVSFNPNVENEKWILEKNSRTDHTSNQKQGSISQKAYKNDPLFEFVNEGRDKLNYVTKILDIDMWNGSNSSYPATLSNGKIVITSYSGDVIEYDLYYEGDATPGTVTISDGVPTFVPNISL